MNEESSKRLIGLDLVKIIACFLVIALHTCNTTNSQVSISSIIAYASVIAVPLFFMVNGYLLFGKTKQNKWYSYKKIVRILFLTFILNGIICLFYAISEHRFWNPIPEIVLNLFFQEGFFWHFWFFGALLLIYLVFPLLDNLYLHKQKYFIILSGFLIFTQCAIDALNIYFVIKYNDTIYSHIPQAFWIESHFSYFILGGVLKLIKPRITKSVALGSIFLLYGLTIAYQFFIEKNFYAGIKCEYFHDNLLIICLSTILFIYISNIQQIKIKNSGKMISTLASLVMVIYIIHPFVIMFYYQFIRIYINIIQLFMVFIISALLSWMLLKIPYAKNIFRI